MSATEVLDAIAIQASGRKRQRGDGVAFVRELNKADLEILQNPPPKGMVASPVATMRHKHHLLARLVAEGRNDVETGFITGYTPLRISILKNDPAFQELIAHYASNVESIYLDLHQRCADLGLSAVEELQERIEVQPKTFTNRELLDIGEKMLDRSGKVATPQGRGPGPVAISVSFVQAPHQSPAPVDRSVDGMEGGETIETLPIDVEFDDGRPRR